MPALRDDAVAAHGRTDLYAPQRYLVVGTDDAERIRALHRDERLFRHDQRRLALVLATDADASALPGAEQAVAVGKERLQLDGAGARIDLAIGGHDEAAMREQAPVGEHKLDAGIEALGDLVRVELRELLLRPGEVAAVEALQALREAHVVELAHREVHADRVDLRDRGEERRAVLADQISDTDEREARDAGVGRLDLGVREVQLGLLERGLGGGDLPGGVGVGGDRVVELLLRDDALRRQVLVALERGVRVGPCGRSARDRGAWPSFTVEPSL